MQDWDILGVLVIVILLAVLVFGVLPARREARRAATLQVRRQQYEKIEPATDPVSAHLAVRRQRELANTHDAGCSHRDLDISEVGSCGAGGDGGGD